MKEYIRIVNHILENGSIKKNRTGIDTIGLTGILFEHNMAKGFPMLTTKQVPFKCVASELEFFIKGLTDKNWLKKQGNHIWDEWANPCKAPYGHDELSQAKMAQCDDLGPIYGWQWRNFGNDYDEKSNQSKGVDQFQNALESLKHNKGDRRALVSAWNPVDLHMMALPPCHFAFQLLSSREGYLDLIWYQRSVDTALGLPFNITSYALLLHLCAKELGLKEGWLKGALGDVHIYKNHIGSIIYQTEREPLPLPSIETNTWRSIYDWEYSHSVIKEYKSHDPIKFDIAI